MNSTQLPASSISELIKLNVQVIFDYVQEKSTAYPIQSALFGGTFLYLTSRYIHHKIYQWYYQLPPGPVSFIPFIGHTVLTLINPKWHIQWAIYYGQAFTFYQMNKTTVMITDSSIAKEILSKPYAQDYDMAETDEENRN